ncbi:LOB domain-containing protein 4-like protein [Cinnamomum micranthum f. kanehirae]|uniref:LOB domain-containing protein 4-like protein n=1 Tax=Cinnamomum micranthum f. kanehirae TaxID=337451 RepID=A0A443PB40_9MAGN|nr:LOB domain-containing protein 4-like protein [Cinnamomum micranthum f. kanehirae]
MLQSTLEKNLFDLINFLFQPFHLSLKELPMHQRSAVSSMVYEANARVRAPVYGCVGAIASLQEQVDVLQPQLAVGTGMSRGGAHEDVACLAGNFVESGSPSSKLTTHSHSRSLFAMDMVFDQPNK